MKRLALIALPWPLVNRPSAQLGVLKAYLTLHLPQVPVDCFHPFLETARRIGMDSYNLLAADGWAGEAVASAILFPENKKQAKTLYYQSLARRHRKNIATFNTVTKAFKDQLERWVDTGPFPEQTQSPPGWDHYRVAGFTISFNQLLSSLLAARLLKQRWPHLKIIFGGSAVSVDVGTSIKKSFPQVDHVVSGEGEVIMTDLCRHFFCEDHDSSVCSATHQNVSQTKDLARLPCPDYDDFFFELKATHGSAPFSPVLPLEFSRGCWWNRCTFCNLNIQWDGYRFKKAVQVEQEIAHLTKKHQCLDFTFCDNALPPAEAKKLFTRLAENNNDYRFFGEIRASEKKASLAQYRRGGLTTVQVGIEALSNSLLARMDKGVTVADNLMIMKNAAACDMLLEGNLITEFPGSTEKEVQETLACLDLIFPFHPLSTAAFFLGHGSPVACSPKKNGITAIIQHRFNRLLFPGDILDNLQLLVKEYRGDRTVQRRRWLPVVQKVKEWHRFHEGEKSSRPLLFLRDGEEFCIINQTLPDGQVVTHRLSGVSRKVYLYCDEKKSITQVRDAFPEITFEKLRGFLQDLCAKKIFYMDENECLALAPRLIKQ